MASIDQYLQEGLKKRASDLHFVSGDPIRARVHGELKVLVEEPLSPEFAQEALYEIMDATTQRPFEREEAADFAYEIEGVSRFRANAFRHLNGIGGILRAIPSKALTLEDLGMPQVIRDMCKQTSGMILVTGKTGSGKSTTLAAMLDKVNVERHEHMVTIEDPIEYLHAHKNCLVNQRELHADTKSFPAALRAVLRQDPDVVLIGEMRDLETIESALRIAETGDAEWCHNALESQAENIWTIGTVGLAPQPLIVRNTLRNVAETGFWTWDSYWSYPTFPEQWFFEGGQAG